jgi:acyl carrier protein
VGLIRFIEERFSLQIPDADLDPDLFDTPRSVVSYVSGRLKAAA